MWCFHIGGQLQGSDGVRGAIAAKCIGQEIIGRIHMIGIFLMETYTHFARALGCWGHQLLFWATLKFAPCFVPLGLWDIYHQVFDI